MQEELWRTLEQEGAACRKRLDPAGCARAYYAAAMQDQYLRSQREHYSAYLFALHYLPQVTAEDLATQHVVYGKLYPQPPLGEVPSLRGGGGSDVGIRTILPGGQRISNVATPSPLRGAPQGEPLGVHLSANCNDVAFQGRSLERIGFLAPNFCEGSAARFYEALLRLPHDTFKTFAYSLSAEADAFTERVRASVSCFRVLSLENLERAEQIITADALDVLVDLGGHTAGGMTLMLLASHPARRIIEAVGWFDTTGMMTVDELLTDTVMDPVGSEHLLTERPLRLPHAWCFMPSAAMQASRAQMERKEHKTVQVAAFQNFLKVNEQLLYVWKKILARAPQVHLVVRDTMRSPERVQAMQQRLAAVGIPQERVTVEMGTDAYLDDLAHMDFVLDTAPYPGGAMTATALYLGVPVLTRRGDNHSQNVGASILMAAGLPELIATNEEAYVEKAVTFANDHEKLEALQQHVWMQVPQSALCDAEAYARAWVQALFAQCH